MASTLMTHSPKFNSKLTTLEALRLLPEPLALGPRHKPVPFYHLVSTLLREIVSRGYSVTKQQLALAANQASLFAVFDMVPTGELGLSVPARSMSFGLRASIAQLFALTGVAGLRVFLCDNMSMSGDMFAIKRKFTTGMDLSAVIATGFDKFLEQTVSFNRGVERLENTSISDSLAKVRIYDIFANGVVPVRLFDDVNRFYFDSEMFPDCQPRSEWGLHNAFTRAMKDLTPVHQFRATIGIGKAFGLGANEKPVLDAQFTAENV